MLNRVILMGRLTADPELRKTASDLSVTSFTLAVDRNYGKGADRQTDFINCVAWRQTAEFISRYFSKGRLMAVEGSIQVRNYTDKNDNKRTGGSGILCRQQKFLQHLFCCGRFWSPATCPLEWVILFRCSISIPAACTGFRFWIFQRCCRGI